MNNSKCTNYVQTSNCSKVQKFLSFFKIFYFACMNFIEQQGLK